MFKPHLKFANKMKALVVMNQISQFWLTALTQQVTDTQALHSFV